MSVSFRTIKTLLQRRSSGEPLSQEEEEGLRRDARILKRRLAKLQAYDPETYGGFALSEELEALISAPLLTV